MKDQSTALVQEACALLDGLVESATPPELEQRLGMHQWLGWWFARCDPTLYLDLRALRKPEAPWTARVRLDDLDGAVDELLNWNRFRCVYVGAAPRKSGRTEDRTLAGVACLPGFWVDIDDPRPETLGRLRAFRPRPDHIVFTGGGYHGWWRFDQPVKPTPQLKMRLRAMTRVLGGDLAAAEFARIMRVPFSFNRKREVPVQARVVA